MKKENKDKYEIEIEAKGANYAGITMLLLAFIYYSFEIFSGRGSNPAFYSIITVYNAILFGYKSIKLKKHRKLNIFTSVVWGLLTLMLVLDYFRII